VRDWTVQPRRWRAVPRCVPGRENRIVLIAGSGTRWKISDKRPRAKQRVLLEDSAVRHHPNLLASSVIKFKAVKFRNLLIASTSLCFGACNLSRDRSYVSSASTELGCMISLILCTYRTSVLVHISKKF
jgi:hypothetical protein